MNGTTSESAARYDRRTLWLCGAICIAAAVLRVLPAAGDFWLDEIWTYVIVRPLHDPWQIFDQIHHSNNNHLNSLFFYWIGDRENWIWYRVPSLVAGIAAVPLACAIAARHGRLEAIFAAILTGGSFALIHFSSEARGYASAVFFALAATAFLERDLQRPSAARAAAFGMCVVLGFLSHLIFLFYFAGAIAQSAWRLLRSPDSRHRGALQFAALHLPSLLVFFALYRVDLRYLHVGGGNVTNWAQLMSRTIGYSIGLPVVPELAPAFLALALVIAALGLRLSWRKGDDEWVMMSVVIVIAPVFVLSVMRPDVVAVRYFQIGTAFFLLLTSRIAADLYRAGGWRRVSCIFATAVFLIGNAAHFVPFQRLGRGGYSEALRFMDESTASERISVGSDHDFRNGMVLRFYARNLPDERRLVYHERENWPSHGPEWLIRHADQRPDPPSPWISDENGNRYEFVRGFDHGAISGFWWGVYRNASADPGASALRTNRSSAGPTLRQHHGP